MRVLYVNVLPYGAHPGIDALAHGLDHRLHQARIELRTLTTDVRSPDWVEKQAVAIQRGIDARVDGIVVYVLDPTQPVQAVTAARQQRSSLACPQLSPTHLRPGSLAPNIGDHGPSDSALAAASGWRLRRPAADRHAARCASRDLCSGARPSAPCALDGIPAFTLERPRYPVNASLVYPNFNHGVYMAEYLASLLPPQADVAVIGGPEVIDDIELVLGIVHGVQRSGLKLVNDPFVDRHRNREDVKEGGRAAARRVLADFAHLDGLIPFNDETMLGTLEAIDDVGRAGEMKLVSRNGSPQAVAAVRAGRTHGTWDIDITEIGAAVGELVLRVLVNGEQLEGTLTLAPLGRLITSENADSYRPWSERVPYVPLCEGLE